MAKDYNYHRMITFNQKEGEEVIVVPQSVARQEEKDQEPESTESFKSSPSYKDEEDTEVRLEE